MSGDTLKIEPNGGGSIDAYYDPEGLIGRGNTREAALIDLLEQTEDQAGALFRERQDALSRLAEEQRKAAEWMRKCGRVREDRSEMERDLAVAGAACESWDAEAKALREYAEQLKAALALAEPVILDIFACRPVDGDVALRALTAIDAALAKNPNPSGLFAAEASGNASPEASGPVGLGPDVTPARSGADETRKMLETFQPFYEKHALGSLRAPSCIVCGHQTPAHPPAVRHLELPNIIVCGFCKSASDAAYREANGVEAPGVRTPALALGVWLIYFEDAEVRPEVFVGDGAEAAARARFKACSDNWNAHLFVLTESNFHDSPLPPNTDSEAKP